MNKVSNIETARERALDPTEDIIADLKAGKMVILMDDEDRENEGDLIMGQGALTPSMFSSTRRLRARPWSVWLLATGRDSP